MKYLLLFLFIYSSLQAKAQVSFYGPTQVGNGNTQYNYMQTKFDNDHKNAVNSIIERKKIDSNFNHIKYYDLIIWAPANNTDFSNGLKEYLKSKGYKERLSAVLYNSENEMGIDIELDKKDSTLVFTVKHLPEKK